MKVVLDAVHPSVTIYSDDAKARAAIEEEAGGVLSQSISDVPRQIQGILSKSEREIANQKCA